MRLILLIALLVPVGLAACSNDEPADARSAGPAPDRPAAGGAESPEALLALLARLDTPDHRLDLLELVHAPSLAEERTVELLRERVFAETDVAAALLARFGEQVEVAPGGVDSVAIAAAARTGRLPDDRDQRVLRVLVEGGEPALWLRVYRARWYVDSRSLTGGDVLDDLWFFRWQSHLVGAVGVHRRIGDEVRAGAFADAEAALATLDEGLRGPMPAVGGVFLGDRTPKRLPGAGRLTRPDDDRGEGG